MQNLIAKMNSIKTAQVVEIVDALDGRFDDESDIVMNAALNVLEARMSEAEFIAMCDRIAA